ncbi:TraB/GumN family protein [Phocaeicola sp.]
MLPQQPTFIVVDAGHLPGEEGVIESLRKQEYTVEAVL